MVAEVLHQLQHLVRDRIQLDADVALLDLLQHNRMLDGGEAVSNALRSQQDGVDLW